MKKIIIAILLLFCMTGVFAMTFDYARNPQISDLAGYSGSSNQVLRESNPNIGFFFLHTTAANRYCSGGQYNGTTSTIIANGATKNVGDCQNLTDFTIDVSVDNPQWSQTPFAQIGDYNKVNEHITVVPYTFNSWVSTDTGVHHNDQLCTAVHQYSPNSVYTKTGYVDLGGQECNPQDFLTDYEYYLAGKKGVCTSQVNTALDTPGSYYTHPGDLAIPGVGTPNAIGSPTCGQVMYPEIFGTTNHVNSLYYEQPEIIYATMYDPNIQYVAYPFYIKDVAFSCYDGNGRTLASDHAGAISHVPNAAGLVSPTGTQGVQTYSIARYPTGTQYYSYLGTKNLFVTTPESSVINDFTFEGNTNGELWRQEVLNRHISYSCPSGTLYYSVGVTLTKNPLYRQLSPVDWTYHLADVFNSSFGSYSTPVFQYLTGQETALTASNFYKQIEANGNTRSTDFTYTVLGGYATGAINSSVLSTQNDMRNMVTEYNFTISSDSSACNPGQDCHAIPNPVTNGSTNLSSSGFNGGSTTTNGGSVIGGSTDDSAVSGLMSQAGAQNNAQVKQGFMDNLIQIGSYILQAIIIGYEIIALTGMIFLFITIINIPNQMKIGIKQLFDAGVRK